MTDLLLPTYTNLLTSLSAWLTKASEHHADTGALMSARLAPDMFPLATQIRFVCVQAYEGVGRLRGEAFPPVWLALLEEGRNAASAPGTLADAQARLRDTLSYLASLPPGVLDGKGHLAVAHELPNGMVFDMTGDQYVRDWALPQLYFHVMTAYAILRHQGVPLGKADYVQYALGYLRPGTMPGAPA